MRTLLINKRTCTYATLRIMKTPELIELEKKGQQEEFLIKKYKRFQFWTPVITDLLLIVPPFKWFGFPLEWSYIIPICLIAIIANILFRNSIDSYFEKLFKEFEIEINDDMKPQIIKQFQEVLEKTIKEEMKKEEIEDYQVMFFGIRASQYCYEIPVQYNTKIY